MRPIFILWLLWPGICFAQHGGPLVVNKSDAPVPSHSVFVYQKPKPFSFVTDIPRDIYGFTRNSFKKKNRLDLLIVGASTATLLLLDKKITRGFQHFCKVNGIQKNEEFSPLIQINVGGKPTNIGKIPKNINTAFYDLGQGSATILLAGGFYIAGKITKNYRALQTASQLTESFIAMGAGTQLLKYITGRENPSEVAYNKSCRWRPAPKWGSFQKNKPLYDAFPSGHLATLISTITIISQNYPEKKWIKPVGYLISALTGLSMINNGVHWASDFPLAIAMGYGYAKYINKKRRFQIVSGL